MAEISHKVPVPLQSGEYQEHVRRYMGPTTRAREELGRMNEISRIINKYDVDYVRGSLDSLEGTNAFALTFTKDVAELFDTLTRIRSVERNPKGFSLEDAPILGLLVRVAKLLKEVAKYYEEENAEMISLVERPLLEASIIACYLLMSDQAIVADYRKCAYKDRLRILRDLENGGPIFETKAGKRLVSSVRQKMQIENLSVGDFEAQKKNRWRIQGKTFFEIFAEIVPENLYASTYGMMSESIHGSWLESVDWYLTQNDDGTWLPYLLNRQPDVRYLMPIVRFASMPFEPWLARIGARDAGLTEVIGWIERVNTALFKKFDQYYPG